MNEESAGGWWWFDGLPNYCSLTDPRGRECNLSGEPVAVTGIYPPDMTTAFDAAWAL